MQDSADRRKHLNKSKPSGKLSNEVCDVHSVSKSHRHNVVHKWLKPKEVHTAVTLESATKLPAVSYDFAAHILSQTMTMTTSTSIRVLQ
jgi:hypothetical protein